MQPRVKPVEHVRTLQKQIALRTRRKSFLWDIFERKKRPLRMDCMPCAQGYKCIEHKILLETHESRECMLAEALAAWQAHTCFYISECTHASVPSPTECCQWSESSLRSFLALQLMFRRQALPHPPPQEPRSNPKPPRCNINIQVSCLGEQNSP